MIAGLAFSIGAYGNLVANYRFDAIAAESTPSDSINQSLADNSSLNESSYVGQLRSAVSAMRSDHSNPVNRHQSSDILVAQAVANRGSIGANGWQTPSENSVTIPVPAPKVQVFKRPTPSVATVQPYFSQPGYTRGGEAHDLPEEAPATTGTTSMQFAWPTQGKLTSKYGRRWGRMHRGIDIAGPVGTPIYAAADGIVVESGWHRGGYGNLVEIRHIDGTITRYAHNSRIHVATGQQVRQGQQIADMGSTGRSTGSHLHFEIRPQGGSAVNPMKHLIASR
jgi:murein DD-endopeptidase MepM/ murein hydrolase activator NlpD